MQVWEHLSIMAKRRPIAGNMGGSALTMFSSSGLVFGVLQVGLLLSMIPTTLIPGGPYAGSSMFGGMCLGVCMQWHTA